jgi:hypothetical protein
MEVVSPAPRFAQQHRAPGPIIRQLYGRARLRVSLDRLDRAFIAGLRQLFMEPG